MQPDREALTFAEHGDLCHFAGAVRDLHGDRGLPCYRQQLVSVAIGPGNGGPSGCVQHSVEPMGADNGGGHRRPQPLGPNCLVEVVGDRPTHAVIIDGHRSAQHRCLPAETFLRPDNQPVEFLGEPAHHGHHFHRVILSDAVRSGGDVGPERTMDDLRAMSESRYSVEQRQHRVELGTYVQESEPPLGGW